jgi:hypothetical protein
MLFLFGVRAPASGASTDVWHFRVDPRSLQNKLRTQVEGVLNRTRFDGAQTFRMGRCPTPLPLRPIPQRLCL